MSDGADFIKRLVNAWDCCGTCAGGVLAQRDREIRREVADAALAPVEALLDGRCTRPNCACMAGALRAAIAQGRDAAKGGAS